MDFQTYTDLFETIITHAQLAAPYNDPAYLNYTKLNAARMRRWMKTGVLSEDLINTVGAIDRPQQWIVITEPWCGDAAHNIPFIERAARMNPRISIDYELRDSEPFRINDYLTNGGKAIPKLIVRDTDGNDLATWGPRPERCQLLFHELKAAGTDAETLKTELQKWYNANEGKDMQAELAALLTAL